MGWREGNGPYQWLSYSEVYHRFIALGSGLIHIGFKPVRRPRLLIISFTSLVLYLQKDMIGIYSRNRPEWVITEQAANAFSMIVVPLYDTLGEEAVEHILTETKVQIIFCTSDKIKLVEMAELRS